MTNIAFVLGNGRSRLNYPLHELKTHGKIYGCNALYRDFTPDVLVATDKHMADEIEKTEYPKYNEFWTRNPTNVCSRKIDVNYGYSSGPIAVTLAARNEHKKIYLIGFDLIGIKGQINNVYAGTPNYRPAHDKETYWGNWDNQLFSIMKDQFHQTRFIRVKHEDTYTPENWKKLPNYKEQEFQDFLRCINNKSWQKQNV